MTFAIPRRPLKSISALLVAGLAFALVATQPAVARAETSPLVIYQVQTGASDSAKQEYITIYNNTDKPAEVTNRCVTYASASGISQTQLGCLTPPDTATKLFLPPYQSFSLATPELAAMYADYVPDLVFTSGIAATSGHIKLLDPSKLVADTVGWGSATRPEGWPAAAPTTGKVLQRYSVTPELLQDSDDNAADFYDTELVLSPSGNIYEESVVAGPCVIPEIDCVQLPVAGPLPILSEILPDADGADAGKEFVELYNPSDTPINLAGYSLRLSPYFTKPYLLPATVLQPKSYAAFSDIETGLTLPNTSATVRLVAPDERVAGEVSYAGLDADVALAYAGGSWQKTYKPTPGSKNIVMAAKPCPAGQIRSPESGYCRNSAIAAAARTSSCKPGQVRNLETNRCRKILTAATARAACKPGQQRNAATNRCRNIPAAKTPKPCSAGQERNPASGRCKKITALAMAGSGDVKDVPSPLVTNSAKWWIAGAAALGTAGYAAYEWRREIFSFATNLKDKLAPN